MGATMYREPGRCPKCGKELVAACPHDGCRDGVEVYSRIVGYMRPVATWNDGKAQEFADRKTYQINRGDHDG